MNQIPKKIDVAALAGQVAQPGPAQATEGSVTAAALVAFVTGAVLIYAAGFANADALHNAAHDSRHSMVFPCH